MAMLASQLALEVSHPSQPESTGRLSHLPGIHTDSGDPNASPNSSRPSALTSE